MTAEEKTLFGYFLKLTGDYLAGGHVRYTEPEKPKLPLAYTTEEPADFSEAEETPEITSEIIIGDSLEAVAENISACKACGLATARTQVVPGEGASNPLVMVIGEGPGADEDVQGKPFVGRAGQLLDRMLASIGLSRYKTLYINLKAVLIYSILRSSRMNKGLYINLSTSEKLAVITVRG